MKTIRSLILLTSSACVANAQLTLSIQTPDDASIAADRYGSGERSVVLVHGGRFRKESWKAQAVKLVAAGFVVLAINFRGEGKAPLGTQAISEGDAGRLDVLGAVHYLKKTGAKSVSVVGASMGGDYAAEAAEAEPDQIERLVLLASGAYTALTRMKGPKLFILARDDANAEGPRLPKIRAQFVRAAEPKRMILLDGSAHAQFLFKTPQGVSVMHAILEFLQARRGFR